jgi:hypothetical protein
MLILYHFFCLNVSFQFFISSHKILSSAMPISVKFCVNLKSCWYFIKKKAFHGVLKFSEILIFFSISSEASYQYASNEPSTLILTQIMPILVLWAHIAKSASWLVSKKGFLSISFSTPWAFAL